MSRNRGLILTLSSFAGATPSPLLATYSGSKAFLQTWSDALQSELQDTGIDVECVSTYFVVCICSSCSISEESFTEIRLTGLKHVPHSPFVSSHPHSENLRVLCLEEDQTAMWCPLDWSVVFSECNIQGRESHFLTFFQGVHPRQLLIGHTRSWTTSSTR